MIYLVRPCCTKRTTLIGFVAVRTKPRMLDLVIVGKIPDVQVHNSVLSSVRYSLGLDPRRTDGTLPSTWLDSDGHILGYRLHAADKPGHSLT